MNTFEKIKKSWWVLFPFTFLFPGVGFIYIGIKASNRNWIIEGITYQMPWVFYLIASAMFSSKVMVEYYGWLLILAVLIALVRSIMVAIKLMGVYEKNDVKRISATTYSTPNSGGSTATSNKKDNDSKWPACCACLILIFIIFAIVSIL